MGEDPVRGGLDVFREDMHFVPAVHQSSYEVEGRTLHAAPLGGPLIDEDCNSHVFTLDVQDLG